MKINQGFVNNIFIKGNGLVVNNGFVVSVFTSQEAASPAATPIAYMHFYDGSVTATLPIYDPADITNNQLRIFTGSATGCFDLVALMDSASSGIRIYTGSDTLCIKQI